MGSKRISTYVGLCWSGETVGRHVIVLVTLDMMKNEGQRNRIENRLDLKQTVTLGE